MFESIQVRNFRVLKDLRIGPLGRINLIGGLNNSGKTSLLEAIFLLAGAGDPQLAVNSNVMRGFGPGGIEKSLEEMLPAISEAWKEFFYELNPSTPIEVGGNHSKFGKLALTISAEQAETREIALARPGESPVTYVPYRPALTFRYSGPENRQTEGNIRMTGEGINSKQPAQGDLLGSTDRDIPFSITILKSQSGNIQNEAVILGKLRKQKRSDLLLEALRVVEPNLQSVEDSSASGTPMIWGDVGLPELIPLPVMGEGMTCIARLVLYISDTPNGVLLVDEIENGLHHTVLPKVWEVVDVAAKQFNTQVFATTHSAECIRAAHESLDPEDFRYHRLKVLESGNRSVTYEPEAITAAVKHGFEVR